MKSILPFISLVLFLSSCSQYQVLTMASDDAVQSKTGEFLVESKDVKVTYDFNNPFGTANVSVLNKTEKGLYVDWTKSFVIIGETPYSFYDPSMEITGELDASGSTRTVRLDAAVFKSRETEFVPPQSSISRPAASLTSGRFFDDNNYSFGTEKVKNGDYTGRLRVVRLEKRNSPLRFRVYITLVPEEGNAIDSQVIERSFYLSEIIRTGTNPYRIFPAGNYRDRLVLKRVSRTGMAAGVTATVGLLLLAGAR